MKLQLKRSIRLLADNLTAQPPSVTQMEYGELAINYGTDPTIFLKDSSNAIQKLQLKAVPDITPGTTLDDRYVQLDGSSVLTGDLSGPKFIGGVASVVAAAPASAVEGQLYWDTGDNRLYIYTGSAWVDASPDTYNSGEDFYLKTDSDARYVIAAASSTQTINNDIEIGTGVTLYTSGASAFNGTMTMSGDIIPSADNTYSLGSPDKMWQDVYIGPGSLYMNGVKILESTGPQMLFSADNNQNIIIQTSGDGDIELDPTGLNGIVQIKSALQILDGKKITNSQGNAIEFGNDIAVDAISSVSAGTDLVLTGAGTGKVKIVDIAEATSFVKTGGTASQFLKADGSVDSETYTTTVDLASESSARGTAITNAINQEVTDRNAAITASSGDYLEVTGGSLSGYLTLHADPVTNLGAATKQYVTSSISAIDLTGIGTNANNISTLIDTVGGKVSKTGATMTGSLLVNNSNGDTVARLHKDGFVQAGTNANGVKMFATGAISGVKDTAQTYVVTSDGAATFGSLETDGDVTVGGNLVVNGTTTTLNTSELSVEDAIIVIAKNADSEAAAINSGFTLGSTGIDFKFDGSQWATSKGISADGDILIGGTTAITADIALQGDGSATFAGRITASSSPTNDNHLVNRGWVNSAITNAQPDLSSFAGEINVLNGANDGNAVTLSQNGNITCTTINGIAFSGEPAGGFGFLSGGNAQVYLTLPDNTVIECPYEATEDDHLANKKYVDDKVGIGGAQSDWNQANETYESYGTGAFGADEQLPNPDYIKNKPTKLSDFTNDGDGTPGSAFTLAEALGTAAAKDVGVVGGVQGYNADTVVDSEYTTVKASATSALQSGAIGATVQGYNADTVVDSEYSTVKSNANSALQPEAVGVSVQGYAAGTVVDSDYATFKSDVVNNTAAYITAADVPTTAYGLVLMDATTPATTHPNGSIWWNREDGQMYVLFEDEDSKQWIAATAPRLDN